MSLNRHWLLPLVLTILPLVIVGIGSLWGTQYMLQGIASSVNQQEHERTALAVHSAFEALNRQFVGLMIDNAPWDDAVQNSYGSPNLQWLQDTWGTSTLDNNYDTSFVLRSDGSVVAAFQAGGPINLAPEAYFGAGYAELFAPLPLDNTQRLEQVSLIALREPGAFALIGLGRILPTQEGLPAPAVQPNILVFSRRLSPALLAELARQYGVDDLGLRVPGSDSPPETLLFSALGSPVAMATWTPRDPGLTARAANSRAATAIVLGLLGLLVPVVIAYFRLARMLQASEREARQAARHDPLSGLPNRILLLERLESYASSTAREPLALLFIDLDGFKAINDVYDHAVGDILIRSFGQGLLKLVQPQDLVARLGGDEFAILLHGDANVARAESLAHAIVAYARQPFLVDGKELLIGASIGLADWSTELADPAEFMRRADIAMYSAKEAGRNTWRQFSHTSDVDKSEDLRLAAALRKLLEEERLQVVYQPIVDAHSQTITGVEALARWPEPEAIATHRLIRVAEDHGLIEALFRQLALRAMGDLQAYPALNLSLNVSALQLINHRIINDLRNTASSTGFALARLELEFTESHLIHNANAARLLIGQLQQLGIRIGLDDFGTGFASLGYLRDFPFDTIKLDQSLIRDAFSSPASRKIIQGTIMIASSLSSDVVAEGIETREQADFMTQAGCRSLQGYYFHKPLPITALRRLLAGSPEPAGGRIAE